MAGLIDRAQGKLPMALYVKKYHSSVNGGPTAESILLPGERLSVTGWAVEMALTAIQLKSPRL